MKKNELKKHLRDGIVQSFETNDAGINVKAENLSGGNWRMYFGSVKVNTDTENIMNWLKSDDFTNVEFLKH